MISLDKIEAFRDEVNKDKFVLSKYKMVNGKNQWKESMGMYMFSNGLDNSCN